MVRGIITLTLMILFVLYTVWAWSNAPKKTFDALSRMPLEDDEDLGGGPQS
ncbi:MAG: cbb3-type cytochrome c oxidase subunit 3 [Gammaproteobacteria bacterium]|nr:cbb3-type cytochrome c oxidase subunit 3 [Gammaproteobacteria bacterium]